MENLKATFKAVETLARAKKENQTLEFYFKGAKIEFSSNYYEGDENTGADGYIINAVNRYSEGMNIEKITNKELHVFTYTMFGKKVTDKVPFEFITLTK